MTGPDCLIVKVANVGKRFALNVRLSAYDGSSVAICGGVAGEESVLLKIAPPPDASLALGLEWLDGGRWELESGERFALRHETWVRVA